MQGGGQLRGREGKGDVPGGIVVDADGVTLLQNGNAVLSAKAIDAVLMPLDRKDVGDLLVVGLFGQGAALAKKTPFTALSRIL